MDKEFQEDTNVLISMKKLQDKLYKTPFSGVILKDLLFEYYKENIKTKKQKKEEYQKEMVNFFKERLEEQKGKKSYKYLEKIFEEKKHPYELLKSYYNKERATLLEDMQIACKAFNNLPTKKTRISIFANQIDSSLNTFEPKSLIERIFILLLSVKEDKEIPKNNEELSELYYKYNLLVDDVSNIISCKNLSGFRKGENIDGEVKYIEHEGWEGFNNNNEPFFLTLYNLAQIEFIKKEKNINKVIVTENPDVFMKLEKDSRLSQYPVVCIYRQVKLSVIVLLNLCIKAGFHICYSGNIDPEGIQNADKLKQRYKSNITLIGFDRETYEQNKSKIILSDIRIRKLQQIKDPELQKIGEIIVKKKIIAYEEKSMEKNIEKILKINIEN